SQPNGIAARLDGGGCLAAGRIKDRPVVDDGRAVPLVDDWSFAPGPDAEFVPISVETGWEMQGFADFSGTGIYRLTLE
ncbi:hypothetical protein ACC680_37250, partial [Rhizobium ruizarguesonis]